MKFTEINLKAIFVLTMLLLNVFVSASEKIKVHKTLSKYEKRLYSRNSKTNTNTSSKKTSSSNKNVSSTRAASKHKLTFSEKLKALFIGFIVEAIAKSLEVEKQGELVNKIKTSVVNYCFDKTLEDYEEIKKEHLKEKQKEVPCQAEIVSELLGDMSGESVISECEMLSTIRELENNKFSLFNNIKNKIYGIAHNNKKWEEEYKTFLAKKEELVNTAKDLTEGYIETFKVYKNDASIPEKKKKVAEKLLKLMDRRIGAVDLCEALNECNVLGLLDHIKIIMKTAFGFFKCATTAPLQALMNYGAVDLIKHIGHILNKVGMSAVTSVAKMIFPAFLLPLIVKFIFEKYSVFKKISVALFRMDSDKTEDENGEKALWGMIGEILLNILWLVVVGKRKLKKLRKQK